jgi:hypothetical protein
MTRSNRTGDVQTDADKAWFSITKKIIRSKTYSKLCSLSLKFTDWLRFYEVKSPFSRGYHLIPISLVDVVYARLDEVEKEYMSLAAVFVQEYEQCKEQAKLRLGLMYEECNYPSVDRIRNGFRVDRRLMELTVPGQSKVGSAINNLEKSKAQRQWQEAAEEVTYALREQFRELVAHLADRLEPWSDGKRRALHASAVDKVVEWMNLFNNRNILNDDEMDKLVAQAKEVMKGKPAKMLRDNDTMRVQLQGEMNKVKAALDTLLVNAPSRRISFEED